MNASTETRRVWSVTSVVLANLEADTAEEAQDRLADALEEAGFTVYREADTGTNLDPFEAEAGTEPDTLPDGKGRPID